MKRRWIDENENDFTFLEQVKYGFLTLVVFGVMLGFVYSVFKGW